jgi:hypothetical protein
MAGIRCGSTSRAACLAHVAPSISQHFNKSRGMCCAHGALRHFRSSTDHLIRIDRLHSVIMATEVPPERPGADIEKFPHDGDLHSQSDDATNGEKRRPSVFAYERDAQLRQGSVTTYHESFFSAFKLSSFKRNRNARIVTEAVDNEGRPLKDQPPAEPALAMKLKQRHLQMIAIGGSIGT